VAWLEAHRPFVAIGIASFGPIDPRPGSKTFGYITTTPKVGWRNFDLYGALDVFGVPMMFDTDVNAPAMFECVSAAD
jgi:fructokinase